MQAVVPQFFAEKRPHQGLTYTDYIAQWREKLREPVAGLDKDARKMRHFMRYNIERTERVEAAYQPSEELLASMRAIDEPQLWMVITEEWCGDAAYNLPLINAAASTSEHVDLRIIRRDANLDIMDQYQTAGTRSIPKLVAFTLEGEELFQWGPRPQSLVQERERWKEDGIEGMEMVSASVNWYDAGNWIDAEPELAALIAGSAAAVES